LTLLLANDAELPSRFRNS